LRVEQAAISFSFVIINNSDAAATRCELYSTQPTQIQQGLCTMPVGVGAVPQAADARYLNTELNQVLCIA